MKRKIYYILLFIFISIFLYSLVHIITWNKDSKEVKIEYKEIIRDTKIKEIQVTDEIIDEDIYKTFANISFLDVDLRKLKTQNKDLKGWLKVAGTNINYPFLQTVDNEYYLKHSFKRQYNTSGWLFMDYRNNNFKDQNTIIYAHARLDGTMFGSLKNTLTSKWFNNKNNHIINLVTEDSSSLWLVFSTYKIKTTDDYLGINFSEKDWKEFIEKLQKRSVHNFNYELNSDDKILTLSTCANSKEKIVLHAKAIKLKD